VLCLVQIEERSPLICCQRKLNAKAPMDTTATLAMAAASCERQICAAWATRSSTRSAPGACGEYSQCRRGHGSVAVAVAERLQQQKLNA
jgi:hypothetical protein